MRSSERRYKLSEYFWVFLKNVPIRIKIMRQNFYQDIEKFSSGYWNYGERRSIKMERQKAG